jgi:septal ring factor EnvC (AmiA/AmiB activator)
MVGAKSAKVVNTCMATTTTPGFRSAFRKQAVNITGAVIIIPSMFVGVFYFLGWMDATYASEAQVTAIQTQQTEQVKKFDGWVYDQKEAKLEDQIERTGDAIFDLERKLSRGTPTETDERQLNKLERRLERYQLRLEKMGPNPSSIVPTAPTE